MVEIQTNVTGDVTAALDAFEAKVKDSVIFSGAAAMALVFYDEVKINAHKLTVSGNTREKGREPGTLESAIYRVYSPEKSSDGVKTYKISVNKTKAPHWHWLEYGNSRIAAHPYIRPSWARAQDAIKAGQDRMAERLTEGTAGEGI